MKKVLLIASCLFLAACSSSSSSTNTSSSGSGSSNAAAAPSTMQADVDRAQAKFPGITLTQLESGRMQYEENCQSCHGLKDPTDYTEDRIRQVVPVMAKKANDRAGRTVVDLEEQDLIMKYMVAISMR